MFMMLLEINKELTETEELLVPVAAGIVVGGGAEELLEDVTALTGGISPTGDVPPPIDGLEGVFPDPAFAQTPLHF